MNDLLIICSTDDKKIEDLLKTKLSIEDLVTIFNYAKSSFRSTVLDKLRSSTGTLETWINVYKNNRSNLLLPVASEKIKPFLSDITDFNELVKVYNKCDKIVPIQTVIFEAIENYPYTLEKLLEINRGPKIPQKISTYILNQIRSRINLINDKNEIASFQNPQNSQTLKEFIQTRLSKLS